MWGARVLNLDLSDSKESEHPLSILNERQTQAGLVGWERGSEESRAVPKPNFAFSTNLFRVPATTTCWQHPWPPLAQLCSGANESLSAFRLSGATVFD